MRVIKCELTRTCDVGGVLFTHPVGCRRLLSAVNDLTTTKKILQHVTSEQLSEEATQRVAPFYDAALSRAQRCLTLMNFMSSTRNRSTATMMCWMKKTTDAISDPARKESVQVALLQTHGEDGAILLMLRRSLIANSFCISYIRQTTCDR